MVKIQNLWVTCEAAPVQAEGELTDGRSIYFRSRHRTIELAIAADTESDATGPNALVLTFEATAYTGYYPHGDTRRDPHIVSSWNNDLLRPLCDVMAEILLNHEGYSRGA